MVNGCYWGGSYDYQFFDFSNLKQGWPELNVDPILHKYYYLTSSFFCQHSITNGIATISHYEEYTLRDGQEINMDDYFNLYNDDPDEKDIYKKNNLTIYLQRQDNMIKMIHVEKSLKQMEEEYQKDLNDEKEQAIKNQNEFYKVLVEKFKEQNLSFNDSLWQNKIKLRVYNLKLKKGCWIDLIRDDYELQFYDLGIKQFKLNMYGIQKLININFIVNIINNFLYKYESS
jgi:hypothetical protein